MSTVPISAISSLAVVCRPTMRPSRSATRLSMRISSRVARSGSVAGAVGRSNPLGMPSEDKVLLPTVGAVKTSEAVFGLIRVMTRGLRAMPCPGGSDGVSVSPPPGLSSRVGDPALDFRRKVDLRLGPHIGSHATVERHQTGDTHTTSRSHDRTHHCGTFGTRSRCPSYSPPPLSSPSRQRIDPEVPPFSQSLSLMTAPVPVSPAASAPAGISSTPSSLPTAVPSASSTLSIPSPPASQIPPPSSPLGSSLP